MKIIWKNSEYGKRAYVGKIKIGGYFYNSITKSPNWKVNFFYDSYSKATDFLEKEGADTESECMKLVEQAFKKFMDALK